MPDTVCTGAADCEMLLAGCEPKEHNLGTSSYRDWGCTLGLQARRELGHVSIRACARKHGGPVLEREAQSCRVLVLLITACFRMDSWPVLELSIALERLAAAAATAGSSDGHPGSSAAQLSAARAGLTVVPVLVDWDYGTVQRLQQGSAEDPGKRSSTPTWQQLQQLLALSRAARGPCVHLLEAANCRPDERTYKLALHKVLLDVQRALGGPLSLSPPQGVPPSSVPSAPSWSALRSAMLALPAP